MIILLILLEVPNVLAGQLAGIAGVNAGSLRMQGLASMMEKQVINVIEASGIITLVNSDLLKEQLSRNNCLDEKCVLSFAGSAGMTLIITGSVEDRIDTAVISLEVYGLNAPYFGRIVYRYKAEIPLRGINLNAREYNYIAEEHAGGFISGLLKEYMKQVIFKKGKGDSIELDSEHLITGKYTVYRYDKEPSVKDKIRLYKDISDAEIEDNIIKKSLPENISILIDQDFIFVNYKERAEFIREFYHGRKAEIVLEAPSLRDTMIMIFATAPTSALMPLIAPLGHYANGDYSGLSLWALNALPYLYVEYNGLTKRPESYRDERRDIPARNITDYRFGLYMLYCGGLPLVIDIYSGRHLSLAADYQGIQPYLGNTATAVYFSLISGGGGLFYRGYRLPGYLYFHLNNILIYSILHEYSPQEKYNPDKGSYEKGDSNKNRALVLTGVLGIVKTIEIIHVILLKDAIKNGVILEDKFAVEPDIFFDYENNMNIGAKYTYRF